MSTFYPIYEHQFQGRKPSRAQVLKVINKAIKEGAGALEISWGENCLDLTLSPNASNGFGSWFGHGWIKDISGDDLARDLNKQARSEALSNWNYCGSIHHY